MSNSLGDCFREVLLFSMDYAVNHRADGLFLYRIHDDILAVEQKLHGVCKSLASNEHLHQSCGVRIQLREDGVDVCRATVASRSSQR